MASKRTVFQKCLIGTSTMIVVWMASQSPDSVCLNQTNPSMEADTEIAGLLKGDLAAELQSRGWSLHWINKNNGEQNNRPSCQATQYLSCRRDCFLLLCFFFLKCTPLVSYNLKYTKCYLIKVWLTFLKILKSLSGTKLSFSNNIYDDSLYHPRSGKRVERHENLLGVFHFEVTLLYAH